MRKNLLVLLLVASSFVSFAQTKLIESFDNAASDTTIWAIMEGKSSAVLTQSSDFKEGTSALQVKAVIDAVHPYGSYVQVLKRVPEGQPRMDWSSSDSLSIWIKVLNAPTIPANMVFRIHIGDKPTDTDAMEEYVYEHATIVDAQHDWVNLRVALKERYTDGSVVPNDSGFVLTPDNWFGGRNNKRLDFDKIVGFNLGLITAGWTDPVNLPADSLTVVFDGFERFGFKSVPAIIFNGMSFPTTFGLYPWGQSSLDVVTGAGTSSKTNAVKWTLGNEWGNGWTGVSMDVIPSFNLGGSWPVDSLTFKLKTEPGFGKIRMQFESPNGKRGKVITPISDGQWHSYAIALRDMTVQDGAADFDSTNVTKFGFMSDGDGVAGQVMWLTDIWTGNPVFDVLPPNAPTSVLVTPGSFQNLISWNDVPGESNELYNVYYSTSPITDVKAPGVEVVKLKIPEGTQLQEHVLRAPVTNQSVAYYYAITCEDNSGNVSPIATTSTAAVNDAKGVVTVSLNAPTNFVADGDLADFANVPFQNLKLSDGSGFKVTNTAIDGDADLAGKVYLAMDQQNLYVAFDIDDDIVSFNGSLASYLNDCADLYIGLYNWHGASHTSLMKGAEPDYHFRFAKDKALLDDRGSKTMLLPGASYYWAEKFTPGYIIEAKIPFSTLVDSLGDALFVPADGMRVPLNISINDADATGQREGILTYSPYDEDKAWQTPARWLYTWIGTKWTTGVNDNNNEVVKNYDLAQNYPNPFNPSTTINYSLEKSGMVTLKVYDVLGRLVSTLVNQNQSAGLHTVSFNASQLSSGIYFYRIESGSFLSIKKMMLVK